MPPTETPPRTIRESLSGITVDYLKPLVRLIGEAGLTRKGDLVNQIAEKLENRQEVQGLYQRLDDLGKKAVQEAVYDPTGVLHLDRFSARYGSRPVFGGSGRFSRDLPPSILRLFFPKGSSLPTDLRAMLRSFVPQPKPLTVPGTDELPARVRPPHLDLGEYHRQSDKEEVELRVRQTSRAAQVELKALLRLVDAGEVKVSDKTRRAGKATLEAIARILSGGDFYGDEDASKYDDDPASDLTIKPFAWPLILQAAGLTNLSAGRLQLTSAGRKATSQPAHEVIRHAWQRWQKNTLLDEFNRVSGIKGQQSRDALTAAAPRRQTVIEGLLKCPVGRWLRIEEVWRILRASRTLFPVANNLWKLYINELHYGSLGNDDEYVWEHLQGRYVLAFLFEYAATLGLLDVAYIAPMGARNDYRTRWGTDDLSCLSRYDGLLFVRINSLGVWCLGLSEKYEPEEVVQRPLVKVLANLDVVATNPPLDSADALLLERFAERTSEAVWRLDQAKILAAVAEGLTVGELREFLTATSAEPLPHTVAVFLDDMSTRTGLLEDLGAARLIACSDANVARQLAHDRRLRSLCLLAGERHLAFRAADETAVRRALRELGYVLPPQR